MRKKNHSKKPICVLGGGLAGIACALSLVQKGHSVVLFEREARLGGLAGGFFGGGWRWPLEKTYHHVFTNDAHIYAFARTVSHPGFQVFSPQTATLMRVGNNYRTFPVDSPMGLFQFPGLGLLDFFRLGLGAVFLKISPHLAVFRKITSRRLLEFLMGRGVWYTVWEQMFRKKFGKYAEKIAASFIWARIHKRSVRLAYPAGGFESLIKAGENALRQGGVDVRKGEEVVGVDRDGDGGFVVRTANKGALVCADVVSTVPTPILLRIAGHILAPETRTQLEQISYLWAVNLIIESNTPLFEHEYWVNVGTPDLPIMGLVQHTNMIEKHNYNNHHILYVSWYVDGDDELLRLEKDVLVQKILPHLAKINPLFTHKNIVQTYLFRAPYAQPIFDTVFAANPPTTKTATQGLYLANLDTTFPYDRGTNYAVLVGHKAADAIAAGD